MAKKSALVSEKDYQEAVRLAREIEEPLGLAVGRFDPSRMPQLSFNSFPVKSATCAVSPDSSYLLLKKAIDSATSTLLLYIYDVSAPYMIDLLAAAKSRGVTIRAMYDATSNGAEELEALKKVVKASNLKEAPSKGTRSVFTVCHQKFMVIDGKILIVESANWARSSVPDIKTPGKFKKANREWFIRFDDANLADWFTKLFNADFNIPETIAAAAAAIPFPFEGLTMAAAVTPPGKLFPVTQVDDNSAVVTPILSPDNYLKEVKALLAAAEKSISLQQQYILAGDGVRELLETIAARRKKVSSLQVRIISSATFAKNWEATQKTLKAFKLLECLKALNPGPFTHCHNKGVIVDDHSVVVSSTNLSSNSVLRAREAGVLVRSKKITKFFRDVFDLDWKEGLTPDQIAASAAVVSPADVH